MKIQTNPNGWSCLPTAFAMVAGISVTEFIKAVGHDGGAEPYELPGVKAGFHEQECIEVILSLGYSCTPIEFIPRISARLDGTDVRSILFGAEPRDNWRRFVRHLTQGPGVITGYYCGKPPVRGHAVAWDSKDGKVYDPRGGRRYSLESVRDYSFIPRCFWKVQKVCQ